MIQYTISDLNGAEEWFGDLSPSETDKNAFLSICVNSWNSSYTLQPRTIEVVKETLGIGTMQSNEMVFCTPKEAFGNTSDWERNLQACFYSFKDKFESAVKSLPDTSSAGDIVKHFEHLKQKNSTQQTDYSDNKNINICIGSKLLKSQSTSDFFRNTGCSVTPGGRLQT